jgi:hypothetical protein
LATFCLGNPAPALVVWVAGVAAAAFLGEYAAFSPSASHCAAPLASCVFYPTAYWWLRVLPPRAKAEGWC